MKLRVKSRQGVGLTLAERGEKLGERGFGDSWRKNIEEGKGVKKRGKANFRGRGLSWGCKKNSRSMGGSPDKVTGVRGEQIERYTREGEKLKGRGGGGADDALLQR